MNRIRLLINLFTTVYLDINNRFLYLIFEETVLTEESTIG